MIIDLETMIPRERHASIDVESAVVGALITGALRPSDVRDVDDEWFAFPQASKAFLVVLSVVKHERGASLAKIAEACAELRSSPLRGMIEVWAMTPSRCRAWAMRAPKRPEARKALIELKRLACEREDARRRRERAIEVCAHWVEIDARKAMADEREAPKARGSWRSYLVRRRYLRRVRKRALRSNR